MGAPLLRKFPGGEEIARACADRMLKLAREAVEARGRFTVALAGGSTPKRFYAMLATEAAYRDKMPWKETRFFFGDERHVPPDHPDSNYRMASETMLKQAPIDPASVFRIESEKPAEAAAHGYEKTLREQFQKPADLKDGWPVFDLVLLGMGPEGHTASLFPGSWALREKEHWTAWPYVEKVHSYRITLTPPVLRRARHVLVAGAGAEKADALKAVLQGPFESDKFPAQVLRANEACEWYFDQAGAAQL